MTKTPDGSKSETDYDEETDVLGDGYTRIAVVVVAN